MSAAFERVKAFLTKAGLADRIRLPEGSSATVELPSLSPRKRYVP